MFTRACKAVPNSINYFLHLRVVCCLCCTFIHRTSYQWCAQIHISHYNSAVYSWPIWTFIRSTMLIHNTSSEPLIPPNFHQIGLIPKNPTRIILRTWISSPPKKNAHHRASESQPKVHHKPPHEVIELPYHHYHEQSQTHQTLWSYHSHLKLPIVLHYRPHAVRNATPWWMWGWVRVGGRERRMRQAACELPRVPSRWLLRSRFAGWRGRYLDDVNFSSSICSHEPVKFKLQLAQA